MLIYSEKSHYFQNEKYHENDLMLTSFKKFQLTSTLISDSSLIFIESSLTFWQMSNLILILVNKLATAILETDKQLCHVRDSNSEAEDLIQVLSLQAIT